MGGIGLFDPNAPLTDRETQVSALAMTGLDNAACGSALYLSVDTVKTHLRRINTKIPSPASSGAERSGLMYRMLDASGPNEPMLRIVKSPTIDVAGILTNREVEVSRLVARGIGNKAIGAELELSPLTIKTHLARTGKEMGTGDRTLLGEVILMTDALSAPGFDSTDPLVANQGTNPKMWYLRNGSMV